MEILSEKLIAPCGMNCGICLAHLREKNPCHGCFAATENKPKTRVQCKIRNCVKRFGKYCFECAEYPCARLLHLDKRYRERYGMSEIENLDFIRGNGMEKFIENERLRWQSSDGTYCVHDKKYY